MGPSPWPQAGPRGVDTSGHAEEATVTRRVMEVGGGGTHRVSRVPVVPCSGGVDPHALPRRHRGHHRLCLHPGPDPAGWLGLRCPPLALAPAHRLRALLRLPPLLLVGCLGPSGKATWGSRHASVSPSLTAGGWLSLPGGWCSRGRLTGL